MTKHWLHPAPSRQARGRRGGGRSVTTVVQGETGALRPIVVSE
jgi:hypothetical protein